MQWVDTWLRALSDDDLEEALSWTRTREKAYRRSGDFALARAWGEMALALVDEIGRRISLTAEIVPDQLSLDDAMSPRVAPEIRVFRPDRRRRRGQLPPS